MALIKSTILAQISGSINGVTFSHNKGGAYARNRSVPANPQTDRQDQVRTAMSSLAKAWGESLTEQQRTLWRAYGAATTVTNRLGDSIQLSGIAAYQRINLFRTASLGEAPINTPPAIDPSRAPAPSYLNVASNAQTPEAAVTMEVELQGGSAAYGLVIYYSGFISPGIRYYRGPYIGRVDVASTAGPIAPVTLPGLIVPEDTDGVYAAKITCYGVSDSLPIWTVFTDPVTTQI